VSKPAEEAVYKKPEAPFDAGSLYFTFSMSSVDSRDYANTEESRRNNMFGWLGIEGFSEVVSLNTFGMGIIVGGGSLGGGGDESLAGAWGMIFGIDVKNLFWLIRKRVAIPMSLGLHWRPIFADISDDDAAMVLTMKGVDTRNLGSEDLGMTMHFFDLAPELGLQVVVTSNFSLYVGYAYNLSASTGWSFRYKIPGKYYEENVSGDSFDVPDYLSPLHKVKEHYLGVPGALRVGVKIHINN